MTPGEFMLLPLSMKPDACDALFEGAHGASRIRMPHRTHPAFLLGMKVCAKYARAALETQAVSGLGSDYFSVSAGFATHTDNDFVKAVPGSFMSVWLPLADVTEFNGPLAINGKAILCNKGDVLLIDGDAPHRSCAGFGPRPVALFTYIKTGWPYEPGEKQQRAEVAV